MILTIMVALSQAAVDRAKLFENAQAVLAHHGTFEQRGAAFPEFRKIHPKLFNMICSGRCDLGHLQLMLSRLADVEAGTMSVEEASAAVAGSLNATYIESVVLPPTTEQAVAPGQETNITVVQPRDSCFTEAAPKRACMRK